MQTWLVYTLDDDGDEVNSWTFDSKAEAEAHVAYIESGAYNAEEDSPLDAYTRISIEAA